jgi:hypothetical protein
MSIIRVASTDSLTVFDLVMLVEINDRTGINATDKTNNYFFVRSLLAQHLK